jgi:hypothetical protein
VLPFLVDAATNSSEFRILRHDCFDFGALDVGALDNSVTRFPITKIGLVNHEARRQPETQFRPIHKADVDVQIVLFKRGIDVMDDLSFQTREFSA